MNSDYIGKLERIRAAAHALLVVQGSRRSPIVLRELKAALADAKTTEAFDLQAYIGELENQAGNKSKCSYCGKPAEGNYSIHRDGFCMGPEVKLCDACGSQPIPTEAAIWAKIGQSDICLSCDEEIRPGDERHGSYHAWCLKEGDQDVKLYDCSRSARLDADRNAKPLTTLVKHSHLPVDGACFTPQDLPALDHELVDNQTGKRVKL